MAILRYSHSQLRLYSTNHRMNVSGYSGNVGDQMTYHSGAMFSTFDEDHDEHGGNCASSHKGAWWYKSCHTANLNGEYLAAGSNKPNRISWNNAKPGGVRYYTFKVVETKLKFNV